MMSDVTASPSAIARHGATPEFVALCKTLYGDLIDADEVWDEVIKAGPDQADVHASGQRRQAQAAFASNAFGGTMGVLATKDAIRAARSKVGGGKLIPTKAKVAAGLIAAGQGLNVAGDINSSAVTGRQAFARKKEKVGKVSTPALGKVVAGHVKQMGELVPASHDVVPGEVVRAAKPKSRAERAGQLTGRVLTTAEGRTGLAAGAVGAGAVGRANTARRNAKSAALEDAYYGKADGTVDVTWTGEFSKLDDDQRLAFGWASVTELNGSPVIDRQGDYITTDDIEKAAYDYVHKSRVGGDMHRRAGEAPHKVSDLVESIVFTDDKIAKMGLPHDFPRGWWVGFKIHDDDTWAEVKKGGRTGFSIHGKGMRKDHDLDSLMGY